jgi:hypothetical protein
MLLTNLSIRIGIRRLVAIWLIRCEKELSYKQVHLKTFLTFFANILTYDRSVLIMAVWDLAQKKVAVERGKEPNE